jgi:hypothetical protein
MGAAECRKKVVERYFVRQVYCRESEAPLVAGSTEEIIITHREVKEVPKLDPGGIVIGILSPSRWDLDEC